VVSPAASDAAVSMPVPYSARGAPKEGRNSNAQDNGHDTISRALNGSHLHTR
jgi:hypothetical protein